MLDFGVIRRFGIVFFTLVREDKKKSGSYFREGNHFSRIIETSDEKCAEVIAKAMVGEEIYPHTYLAGVKSVKETPDDPSISSFCSEHYTWERVFSVLALSGGLRGPLQLIRYSAGRTELISGVIFSQSQRRTALSRIL